MSDFKKGQKVNARTPRGSTSIAGTVSSIEKKPNGTWIGIKPNDKDGVIFFTRPACVTPA